MPAVQETIERVRNIDIDQYKYGFVTDIESDKAPKGLSEDTVCFIAAKKNDPAWMLEWRLNAYRRWLTMREPQWARVDYGPIDYQDLYYYSAPKRKAMASLDEVDPEILKTYAKLGIPLREQEMLAGVERQDGTRSRVASMQCSPRSRSQPPSRRSSPRPACSSCRSPRRCRNILSW